MSVDTVGTRPDFPAEHPAAPYLRMDRIPHVWCPGCGIGTVVKCFSTALERTGADLDKTSVVSGIGCSGRAAGYLKLDGFHATHGRAIPFATGLKLGRPELLVTVFSGDGDLSGIGGNHFIHAARRNMDLLVILINNFIYGMTGGQNAPTTPLTAKSSTMPFGNFEPPFNIPHLASDDYGVQDRTWRRRAARPMWRAGRRSTSGGSPGRWKRRSSARASA